ncbi:hypothetical protein HOD08_02695, partial [bacterium]|nr:hypothetical protein [bacterium]
MRAISFIAVLTIFCVCSNIDAARRRRVTPKPKVDPVPIPVKPPPPTAVPKKVDDLVAPVKEGVQKAIEKIVPSKAIPAPVEEPEVPQTVMCDDVMIYTPDGIRLEFDLVRLAEIDVLLGMQKNALAKGETVDGVVSSGFVFLGKFLKDHETILPHLPSDLYKLTYKIFKHAEIRADEFEEFPEKFMPLMKWMYESFPYKEGFWGGNKDELEILAKKFSERANKEFVPAG